MHLHLVNFECLYFLRRTLSSLFWPCASRPDYTPFPQLGLRLPGNTCTSWQGLVFVTTASWSWSLFFNYIALSIASTFRDINTTVKKKNTHFLLLFCVRLWDVLINSLFNTFCLFLIYVNVVIEHFLFPLRIYWIQLFDGSNPRCSTSMKNERCHINTDTQKINEAKCKSVAWRAQNINIVNFYHHWIHLDLSLSNNSNRPCEYHTRTQTAKSSIGRCVGETKNFAFHKWFTTRWGEGGLLCPWYTQSVTMGEGSKIASGRVIFGTAL